MSVQKRKCCKCHACTTYCFKVTFSGVTFVTGSFDAGNFADVPVTSTTQGTLNGVGYYACLTEAGFAAGLPVAHRVDGVLVDEDDDPINSCGYLTFGVFADAAGNFSVTMGTSSVGPGLPNWTFGDDANDVFFASGTMGAEMTAVMAGDQTCEYAAGFTATASNSLTFTNNYMTPFINGTGSVTIEIVCNCDGSHDPFLVDCSTPEGFAQTLCDEDDCPCGRTSEQPTCLLVTIKGSDGIDSVYQTGVGIISGSGGRTYTFHGPYRRTDGTWWRFIVVNDSPGDTTWGADAAYFEHQCPGDGEDSYSGTYTLADDADWTGDVATTLAAHQTALTGIGTAVTVAACTCEGGPDVFNVSIQCDIGTTPDGWTDIEVTRSESDVCTYEGDDGTYEVTLNYNSGTGEWTCEIRRIADGLLIVDATWSGSGDDPTGTHGFGNTDTGFPDPGDEFLDEACSALSIIIS